MFKVCSFLKTMAARGPVNGRGPLRRSGRDLVFSTTLYHYIIDKSFIVSTIRSYVFC